MLPLLFIILFEDTNYSINCLYSMLYFYPYLEVYLSVWAWGSHLKYIPGNRYMKYSMVSYKVLETFIEFLSEALFNGIAYNNCIWKGIIMNCTIEYLLDLH